MTVESNEIVEILQRFFVFTETAKSLMIARYGEFWFFVFSVMWSSLKFGAIFLIPLVKRLLIRMNNRIGTWLRAQQEYRLIAVVYQVHSQLRVWYDTPSTSTAAVASRREWRIMLRLVRLISFKTGLGFIFILFLVGMLPVPYFESFVLVLLTWVYPSLLKNGLSDLKIQAMMASSVAKPFLNAYTPLYDLLDGMPLGYMWGVVVVCFFLFRVYLTRRARSLQRTVT